MSSKARSASTARPAEIAPEAPDQRRPYSAPRVLSAELLEAAATTCTEPPPSSTYGKTVGPFLCQMAGS